MSTNDPNDLYSDLVAGAPTAQTATLKTGQYDYFGVKDIQDQQVITGVSNTPSEGSLRAAAGGYAKPQGLYSYQTTDPNSLIMSFASQSQTDPNGYLQLQQQLYLAGAYGSSTPNWGIFNSAADGSAMRNAITSYLAIKQSGSPITFADYIDKATQSAMKNGRSTSGGGPARAPLQVTATGTLNQYANQAGQSELGRNTTADEQAAFASKYHGEEQAAYNGSKEAAGAPDAEAKNFVDTNNQQEVQTHLQADYAERMLSMLGVQSS